MLAIDARLLEFGRGGMERHMDVSSILGTKMKGALVLTARYSILVIRYHEPWGNVDRKKIIIWMGQG